MFTLTTATGKKFDSDYAATIATPPRLSVSILHSDFTEVAMTFLNPAELPLEGYEGYRTVQGLDQNDRYIMVTLMP